MQRTVLLFRILHPASVSDMTANKQTTNVKFAKCDFIKLETYSFKERIDGGGVGEKTCRIGKHFQTVHLRNDYFPEYIHDKAR